MMNAMMKTKKNMTEIFFKAGKRKSASCDGYRQIIKHGNLEADMAQLSDDVINFYPANNTPVIIDCNKKTGEFRIAFTPHPHYK